MLQSPKIGTDDITRALNCNSPGARMDALLQAWLARKTQDDRDAMVRVLIGEVVALRQMVRK